MKKSIIVSAAVVTMIGAGFFGVTQANAATTTVPNRETLIQRITDTFHLNKDDVQKVFDQFHTDRVTARVQKYNDRLDQAVKDGKITSAQEQLILDKRKELQSKVQDYKNMTKDQRKAAKKQEMQDVKTWAQQNNIDLKYLMPGFGKGRGRWMMHQ